MASLQAEASMLELHQNIANEELRINQLEERLALDTQLAKMEAEERVCLEFKLSTGTHCEGVFDETESHAPSQQLIGFPAPIFSTVSKVHAPPQQQSLGVYAPPQRSLASSCDPPW